MPTVILIGLLILGLCAGFYFSQKAKELSKDAARSPGNLLYRQARRQIRSWLANFSDSEEK